MPLVPAPEMFAAGFFQAVVNQPTIYDSLSRALVATLAFTVLGVIIFALTFWIIVKAAPFSVRKEIEEDHNTAVALIIAAVIIGIALIISAAVHG